MNRVSTPRKGVAGEAESRLNGRERSEITMAPLARGGVAAILSMALVLAVLLYVGSPFQQYSIAVAMGYAIAASSVAVAFGALGLLALEQAGVMGIGAFTTVFLIDAGLPVLAVMGASIAVGLVVGLGFGLLAGQIDIFPYAIVGFAFSFLFTVVGSGPLIDDFTGGHLGKPITHAELFGLQLTSGVGALLLSGGALILVLIAEAAALRSSIGSTLLQVRANPQVTATLGIDQARARTLTVMFLAGISALGGGVTVVVTNYVTPGQFGPHLVVTLLAMALVGGVNFAVGPVIGALSLVAIPELLGLRVVDRQLLVAVVFLVVVLISGRGIADLVERSCRYMWRTVVRQREPDLHPSADATPGAARDGAQEQ